VSEGKGKVGLAVSAIIIPGEISIYGPVSTDDLVEMLNEFNDCQGRVIMFDQPQKTNLAREVVYKIHLPPKNCSILFGGKGRHVKILKVDGDSRTRKKVKVGQSVRRLEFPGESPYFASSVGAKTLNVILSHHENTQAKVLVVGQPFYASGPKTEKMVLEETPQESEVKKSMGENIRNSIHLLKEQTKHK